MNPRRTLLRLVALSLLVPVALSGSSPDCAADGPTGADWPMFAGPGGTYAPTPSGLRIVDRLDQMRLLWTSEFDGLGQTKLGDFALRSINGKFDPAKPKESFPGGLGSPIVADGKVFVAYFKPSGPLPTTRPLGFGTKGLGDPAIRIAADDGVVAIDAGTGKTVWHAVNAAEGLNHINDKRGGWGVTPICVEGVVVSLGTAGILSGYDAKTGRRLWHDPLPGAESLAADKANALAAGKAEQRGFYLSNLTVAEGLAIVPDQHGGLVGVDPRSGQTRWRLRADKRKVVSGPWSTPGLWRHDGKTYVLANSGAGQLRLVDPASGNVLWVLDGLGPYLGSPYVFGDFVLVNANPVGDSAADKVAGRLAAVRLTAAKGEIAWKLPAERKYDFAWWMDRGAEHYGAHRDGTLYYWLRPGHKKDAEGQAMLRLAIDAAAGTILSEQAVAEKRGKDVNHREQSQPLLVEDRLFATFDPAHSPRKCGLALYAITGRELKHLDHDSGWPQAHEWGSGYEVPFQSPCVDGRLFYRTQDGTVVCYDIRKPE